MMPSRWITQGAALLGIALSLSLAPQANAQSFQQSALPEQLAAMMRFDPPSSSPSPAALEADDQGPIGGAQIAILYSLQGDVRVARASTLANNVRLTTANAGLALANGDTVQTLNGTAEIHFTDQSVITLNQGTKITIREQQTSGGLQRVVQQYIGNLWFSITKATGTRTTLATPTAVAAIRGTQGMQDVPNDFQSTHGLDEGNEFITESVTGQTTTIHGGQIVTAIKGVGFAPIAALIAALPRPGVGIGAGGGGGGAAGGGAGGAAGGAGGGAAGGAAGGATGAATGAASSAVSAASVATSSVASTVATVATVGVSVGTAAGVVASTKAATSNVPQGPLVPPGGEIVGGIGRQLSTVISRKIVPALASNVGKQIVRQAVQAAVASGVNRSVAPHNPAMAATLNSAVAQRLQPASVVPMQRQVVVGFTLSSRPVTARPASPVASPVALRPPSATRGPK